MQIAPYISDTRKKRKKRRKYFLITVGLFVGYFLLLFIAWFIARSALFSVDTITINGNDVVPREDIITLLKTNALQHEGFFQSLIGWNNMLSWPSSVSENELALIPQLQSISISKDYFDHAITATVVERNPFGIWCFQADGVVVPSISSISTSTATSTIDSSISNEACYWFDNKGIIFERATNTEGNLISIVNDYSQGKRGLNQQILPQEFTPNLIAIINTLHDANVGIKEIDLTDLSLEQVTAITTAGPKIYFSLRFSPEDDLEVLKNLSTQAGFNKFQYVDCRTEDRVYYK